MEYPDGSDINKLIGVGRRKDLTNNEFYPVTDFYPSHMKRIVNVFETTPIAKYFNLTIERAMALPVDQWYYIERRARLLKDTQGPDSETRMAELMKQFIERLSDVLIGVSGQ